MPKKNKTTSGFTIYVASLKTFLVWFAFCLVQTLLSIWDNNLARKETNFFWETSKIIWALIFISKAFFYEYKRTKFFPKSLSPPSGSCMQLCCESVQLRCLPCVAKQVRLDLWLFSHVDKSNGCGKKGVVLRSKIKYLANHCAVSFFWF